MRVLWLSALLLCSLTTEVHNVKQKKKVADQESRLHDMEMKIDELKTTFESNTAALIKEIRRSELNNLVHKHKHRHHNKIREEEDGPWMKKQTIQFTNETSKRTDTKKTFNGVIIETMNAELPVFLAEIQKDDKLTPDQKAEKSTAATAKYKEIKDSLTNGQKEFGLDELAKEFGKYEPVLVGIIPKIPLLFKPTLTITQRVQAGIDIVAFIMKVVPYGQIGSIILKTASTLLGLSIPSTNQYTKLRNEILKGVQNMFDKEQFADTAGCIYKIEFMQNMLKRYDNSAMKEREFFSLMLVGGIDLGVSSLGTLKFKMEEFRDKNTIFDGRRAIDMAHYYVLLAQARDGLYQQIIKYIEITEARDKTVLPLSNLFFRNTWDITKIGFKDLFWLDDACCTQNPNHLSALIAYNLPVKEHYGNGKAVDIIRKFIKNYRTQEYYDNDINGMGLNDYLSVDDTSATHETGRATMKRKKNPLDNNHWYVFQNVYDSHKYLGINDQEEVKVSYWSRTGSTWKETAENAKATLTRKGKLTCTDWNGIKNVPAYHMGISNKFHNAKLRIKFPDEPVKPDTPSNAPSNLDPEAKALLGGLEMTENEDVDTFTGEIDEIWGEYTGKNGVTSLGRYIVASRDGVKEAVTKGKIKTVEVKQDGSKAEVRESTEKEAKKIAKEMDEQRKAWDMFVLCDGAEGEATKAKLKVFPVKMPGWDETRYLVVPGGDVMGAELTAFGHDQWSKTKLTSNEFRSNKITIPPEKQEDTLTESTLKEDRWMKVFFTVPFTTNVGGKPVFALIGAPKEIPEWSMVAGNTGETNEVKATCMEWDGYVEGVIEPNDQDFLDKMKTLWDDQTWLDKQFVKTYTYEECVLHCLGRRKTKPYIEGMIWGEKGQVNLPELTRKKCYCMKGITHRTTKTQTGYKSCIFVGEKATYDIATSGKCASVSKMQCDEIARIVPKFDYDYKWFMAEDDSGRSSQEDPDLTTGCFYVEKDGKKYMSYNFVAEDKSGKDKSGRNPKWNIIAEYKKMLDIPCSTTRPCVCAPGTTGQNFKSVGCWEERTGQRAVLDKGPIGVDAGVNHNEIGTKIGQIFEQWRPENDINVCYKLAMEYEYKKFALSNGGRCAGVKDEENVGLDYRRHGPADTCASGIGSFDKTNYDTTFDKDAPKFSGLANDVYEILP